MAEKSLSRALRGLRWGLLVLSGLLALATTALNAVRPAGAAALTLVPPWIWLGPGLVLIWLGSSRATWRGATLIGALWLAGILCSAEDVRGLLQPRAASLADVAAARHSGRALRVVSLNCAGGDPAAAAEVAADRPDVVLLQETPTRPHLETLTRRLFGAAGAFTLGFDTSIVARGALTAIPLSRAMAGWCAWARLRTPEGAALQVVSLRLMPSAARWDLWSADCWEAQAGSHRVRDDQLSAVAERLAAIPRSVPVILGGDFNAPAGDPIFRHLRPHLRDAFALAGRGWGNTMLNDWPILRFDQIWMSEALQPLSTRAHRTQSSDHRMVVCDLQW